MKALRLGDWSGFTLYHVSKHLPPALQRLLHEAPATVGQHVEHVKEQRLRLGAVMLQEIEGDPPAFIQGDNLTVYEGAGEELLTGTGDMRELCREKVSTPGPETRREARNANF